MEKAMMVKEVPVEQEMKTQFNLYKNIVLNILEKMNKGILYITLPDGEVKMYGGVDRNITASINILSPLFFKKIALYGDIGFGEAFVEGYWDTDDITNVISWMILNVESNPALSGSSKKYSPISILKILNRMYHKFNNNTSIGSRKNISEHYDLNNDFFKLWLDDSMTYSSAYFEYKEQSLYDAQMAKYKKLSSELNIKSTDHVLEIGSGWGGFSIHMAEKYGCTVTTVTISEEQYKYAKALIESKKLDNKITILLKDYREITGSFDKIVSVEMLEAVGHEYLLSYFKKINEVLKPDGVLGIQVITSHDSNYEQLRKGVDWIQKYIFPGSLLPSVAAINKAVNKTGNMYLHNLKNFGPDYARTLNEWKTRFNSKVDEIKELGFGESFLRKWNYYLSYCEAAFAMRNISVVQMVYTRPNNRNI